ncbi:aminotransferase class III-fold pyridoxal phosphate-dependent enzyme [Pseudoalteromonas sp. SMS1]|uniref:aminotransferase class III-fold pyridoxal phosphate-dependent enzyme n=1 Tax=Pseudoalteromonas sp. SMS1 TaxID=2908894 RepID=UPI001F262991|nr:aminotransferase class III-fold pyridoxal phosphate-dependent enzyme [Pseudoalteromonas sp. SMS1]MCF2859365.1 aminotransferase class III-fold pyridoxal phosphate-dependent enzyme [Pseudoalteromonas sp. SMS1]
MESKKNSGATLWEKAKKIIPGGNQLLSKRAEMFLPQQWPAYYKKAQGCEIWDLDDKHYLDFSIMGIGSCSLGYAHPTVTEAVVEAVQMGSMSSLNCFEEVELAEKLIEIHNWAGGVRFTRTGGESCALAIRIARSYSGKNKVAFCGYHGWHDWYLATNLADGDKLKEQLLPGLSPSGVPQQLIDTALPFHEGDLKGFDELLSEHGDDLGVVMMEVFRHGMPDLDFIKAVKARCEQHGIVLIFDEISSGFRLNAGAAHLLFDVHPDICVLGKAMGNGHPIGAIIGKSEVMDAAQQSFISSTYWTERVGFVAALNTLAVFEQEQVSEQLNKTGRHLKTNMAKICHDLQFELQLIGVDSVPILVFPGEQALALKTLYTQEMLKRGVLAANVIYVSMGHTLAHCETFLNAFEEVIGVLKQAQDKGDVLDLLDGPVCHSGFQRLN